MSSIEITLDQAKLEKAMMEVNGFCKNMINTPENVLKSRFVFSSPEAFIMAFPIFSVEPKMTNIVVGVDMRTKEVEVIYELDHSQDSVMH